MLTYAPFESQKIAVRIDNDGFLQNLYLVYPIDPDAIFQSAHTAILHLHNHRQDHGTAVSAVEEEVFQNVDNYLAGVAVGVDVAGFFGESVFDLGGSFLEQMRIILIEHKPAIDKLDVDQMTEIVLVNFGNSDDNSLFGQMLAVAQYGFTHIADAQTVDHNIFNIDFFAECDTGFRHFNRLIMLGQ